ncbi:MAG: hypothetical protein JWQ00_3185 [Noviherbaspirillum sp.]|nr:hypothetical protein [Noviherbaspirillum sp.]
MNTFSGLLAAVLCAASLVSPAAQAQTTIEKAPDPLTKKTPGASTRMPGDAAKSGMPDASSGTPANAGIVKVPPTVGTEGMVTKPRNVDPEIAAPTKDIDRKNRQESEEKTMKPKP